jgi:hypothetical protein
MPHNCNTGTNWIEFIFYSDKVVFRRQEIEIHYIYNGDSLCILCTCKADTPNTNLHSNIQCTELQKKQHVAAAPRTILDKWEAAVATLIIILVVGHQTAAAPVIIKTPAPVAMGFTP